MAIRAPDGANKRELVKKVQMSSFEQYSKEIVLFLGNLLKCNLNFFELLL